MKEFVQMKFFNRYKFLLLIVLIGIGYLLFVNNSTLGWKSYTSHPYRIKFKAPPSLLVTLPINRASYNSVDIRDSNRSDEVPAYMIIEYLGYDKEPEKNRVGKVTIGKRTVDRYDISYPRDFPHKSYMFSLKLNNDEVLTFRQEIPKDKEKSLKIFDRILSTIEFF